MMFDILFFPFRLIGTILGLVFDFIGSVFGFVMGLVGSVFGLVFGGAFFILVVVGVIALVRWFIRGVRGI